MAEENKFKVEIITPDRVFFTGEADMIEFNTGDGQIGVYKNHIPLTTVLEPGVVVIHNDDQQKVAAVHAGFAEILGEGDDSCRTCRVAGRDRYQPCGSCQAACGGSNRRQVRDSGFKTRRICAPQGIDPYRCRWT